jgi:hypothetical protein
LSQVKIYIFNVTRKSQELLTVQEAFLIDPQAKKPKLHLSMHWVLIKIQKVPIIRLGIVQPDSKAAKQGTIVQIDRPA